MSTPAVMPDFSTLVNIHTVKSGNASDPTVWNLNRALQAGDFFDVQAGHTLTWDLTSNLALAGGYVLGTLDCGSASGNKVMQLATLVIDSAATLKIGDCLTNTALTGTFTLTFTDTPTDTTFDKGQFGTGLICMGAVVNMCGAASKDTWLWSHGADAGASSITLVSAPTNWSVGDQLLVPGTVLTPVQDETPTIAGSYAGGATIPLTGTLTSAHRGQTIDFSDQSWSAGGFNFTLTFALTASGNNVNVTATGTATQISNSHVTNTSNSFTIWNSYIKTGKIVQFLVPVANLSRKIVFQSANPSGSNRGHIMFMNDMMGNPCTTNICHARFKSLSRTKATQVVTDPQIDGSGNLVAGTDANTRGRYSVHFHRMGATTVQTIDSCVIDDFLKWAITNHDSKVNCTNCVAYNGQGACFATERGTELGTFTDCLGVRTSGAPSEFIMPLGTVTSIFHGETEGDGYNEGSTTEVSRVNQQDFGWEGNGAFAQGPGVSFESCCFMGHPAFGLQVYPGPNPRTSAQTASGNNIYGQSIISTTFPKANLPGSWGYIPANDPSIYAVPFFGTSDITCVGCGGAYRSDYAGYNTASGLLYTPANWGVGNPGGYVITNLCGWNITTYGVYEVYSGFFKYDHMVLVGPNYAVGSAAFNPVLGYDTMETFLNPVVIGWEFGIVLCERGLTLTDGYFQNVWDMGTAIGTTFGNTESRQQDYVGRINYQINGNLQFGYVSSGTLGTRTRWNMYLGVPWRVQPSSSFLGSTDPNIFYQPRVWLLPDDSQLYWPQQAPSWIPFPPQDGSHSAVLLLADPYLSTVLNKTNQQIFNVYGVGLMGDLAATPSTTPYPIITNGIIGAKGICAQSDFVYYNIGNYLSYGYKSNSPGPYFLPASPMLTRFSSQGPPLDSVAFYTQIQPGLNAVTWTPADGYLHIAMVIAGGTGTVPSYTKPSLTTDVLWDGDFSLTPPKSGEKINCTSVTDIPWTFNGGAGLFNNGTEICATLFGFGAPGNYISQQLSLNGTYSVTYSVNATITLQVLLDSTVLQTVTGPASGWSTFTTPSFTASGTHTLKFKCTSSFQTGYITRVSLNSGAPVVPSTPTGLAAAATSSTAIAVSWNSSAGATSYTLQTSTDNSTWSDLVTQAGISFSHTGLTASTIHYYRVKATNSVGSSAYSASVNATTSPSAPSTPTGLAAAAISSSEINVSWNASAGASSYTLQTSTDNSTWSNLATQAGTTYSHTGLSPATIHYYRVDATNSAGSSAFSTSVNATTGIAAPSTPTGLAASATSSTAISISWNASSGASTYTLQRSPDNTTWTGIVTQAGTSYSNTGLTASTTYYYRVDATNSAGSSAFSSSVNATTSPAIPATPTGLAAAATSSTAINISWDAMAGASSYSLERSPDDATWAVIASPSTTSYSNTGLTPSTTYYYRVASTNSAGTSAYSTSVNAATSPTTPSTPTGLAAAATSSTTISVSWNSSAGAATYTLQRSPDNSAWTGIATQAGTTYSDSSLTPNTIYYYRVDATNSAGSSTFSASVNATTDITVPATPTGLAASATSTTAINVVWDAMSGASSYTLQRSLDNATWSDRVTQSGTTFSDSGLSVNTKYFYKVKASNSAGDSAYSASVNATTFSSAPATPTGLTGVVISPTEIDLTWNSSATATSYDLRRSSDNGASWSVVDPADNDEAFADTGVVASTTYLYQVRANNAQGSSAYSASISKTTPAAPPPVPAMPSGLVVTGIGTQAISTAWNSTANATSYVVRRAPDNSSFQIVSTQAGTTFDDVGLASNTTYWYDVQAVGVSGSSAFSPSVAATTQPIAPPATPTGLTVTATGPTTITISWTASAGATSYFVQRSTDGVDFTTIGTPSATFFNDSGLLPSTLYYYQVKAVGDGGTSGFTTGFSATTMPPDAPPRAILTMQ